MSLMAALALLGAICVAWASYLDVRDKKIARRRSRGIPE
jgi:hypothetical protein